MCAASYLMLHEYDNALDICAMMIETPQQPESIEDHIQWKGIQVTLTLIRNLAQSKNPIISQRGFDPLKFEIRTKQ